MPPPIIKLSAFLLLVAGIMAEECARDLCRVNLNRCGFYFDTGRILFLKNKQRGNDAITFKPEEKMV